MRKQWLQKSGVLLLTAVLSVGQPLVLLAEESLTVASEENAEQTEPASSEPAETPAAEPTDPTEPTAPEEPTEPETDVPTEETTDPSSSSSEEPNTSSEETPEAEPDATSEEKTEEEQKPAEEKRVYPLHIIINGKGSVTVIYQAADGKENKATVSGDKQTIALEVAADSKVQLSEMAEKDNVFVAWQAEHATVSENAFSMPGEEVRITAVFKDKNEVENLSADGASKEAQDANANKPAKTNAQLIAEQHIQALPVAPRDFRFWKVDKQLAFANADLPIREDIQEDAKEVGKIKAQGALYILEEVDRDWYYIESGNARGFIKKTDVLDDAAKKELLRSYVQRAQQEMLRQNRHVPVSSYYTYAESTVPALENEAYLYRKCTTEEVVIEKAYTLPRKDSVDILEETKEEARVCGVLEKGQLAYVIAEAEEAGWLYIESGDVRGFVKQAQLRTGAAVEAEIEKAGGEAAYGSCVQKIKPEENRATYYTLTSIKEGVPLHPVRDAIIKSAEQCLGHPYVWGGTSLLGGCDCSGFVQSLYALYGYSIPRVAENQAQYGRQIPVENAEPGDLIFFARNGYVYHVALYVGNDQTIEAYGTAQGIIRNGVDHANAVWATKVVSD